MSSDQSRDEEIINFREESNKIKKLLAEKNDVDRIKEEFEKILKTNDKYKAIIQDLNILFDQSNEGDSYEDLFRAMLGNMEATENEDLDTILKAVAKSQTVLPYSRKAWV